MIKVLPESKRNIHARDCRHRPSDADLRQGHLPKAAAQGRAARAQAYIDKYGQNVPEIRIWKWGLTRE